MRLLRTCLLILLWPAIAGGVVVRTLDGRILDGEAKLAATDHLILTPRTGSPVRLRLDEIHSARFRVIGIFDEAGAAGRWIARDIGQARLAGGWKPAGSMLTLRGSGRDIGDNADEFYFMHMPLSGDGQILARVASIQRGSPRAKAGLMIRATADAASPYAMAVVQADGGVHLLHRTVVGQRSVLSGRRELAAPVWLKLARNGAKLTAYSSSDGRGWDQVGSADVNMPPQVLAGMAVSSANPAMICAVGFDNILLSSGDGKLIEAGNATARGVVLRNGSLVTGSVHQISTAAAKLSRGREYIISLADISRIHMSALTPQQLGSIRPGRKGALLNTGELLQGEIRGIENGRLVVNSILLGLQKIETWKVPCILLGDPAPAGRFEIRLADGSMLLTDDLKIDQDRLTIACPPLEPITAHLRDVVEIHAGPSRRRSLADLQPAASSETWCVDGSLTGEPVALAGASPDRSIAIAAGTELSYALNGEYRMLSFSIGVPDGVLPTSSIRMRVLGDGKELWSSGPKTSMDSPSAATLHVAGIKMLLLRVEPGDPREMPSCALVGDPSLVK